jgi:hypothetical protein
MLLREEGEPQSARRKSAKVAKRHASANFLIRKKAKRKVRGGIPQRKLRGMLQLKFNKDKKRVSKIFNFQLLTKDFTNPALAQKALPYL